MSSDHCSNNCKVTVVGMCTCCVPNLQLSVGVCGMTSKLLQRPKDTEHVPQLKHHDIPVVSHLNLALAPIKPIFQQLKWRLQKDTIRRRYCSALRIISFCSRRFSCCKVGLIGPYAVLASVIACSRTCWQSFIKHAWQQEGSRNLKFFSQVQ